MLTHPLSPSSFSKSENAPPQNAEQNTRVFVQSVFFEEIFAEGISLISQLNLYHEKTPHPNSHTTTPSHNKDKSLISTPPTHAHLSPPHAQKLITSQLQTHLYARMATICVWLLLHSAFKRGETSFFVLSKDTHRLNAPYINENEYYEKLRAYQKSFPASFLDLLLQTEVFYEQIVLLDRQLYTALRPASLSCIKEQMARLHQAFKD